MAHRPITGNFLLANFVRIFSVILVWLNVFYYYYKEWVRNMEIDFAIGSIPYIFDKALESHGLEFLVYVFFRSIHQTG